MTLVGIGTGGIASRVVLNLGQPIADGNLVLHVAARITRGARQTQLRIDQTWRWATEITHAWRTIRAAFT